MRKYETKEMTIKRDVVVEITCDRCGKDGHVCNECRETIKILKEVEIE